MHQVLPFSQTIFFVLLITDRQFFLGGIILGRPYLTSTLSVENECDNQAVHVSDIHVFQRK